MHRRFLASPPRMVACLTLAFLSLTAPVLAEESSTDSIPPEIAAGEPPAGGPVHESAPEVTAVEVEGNKIVSTSTILTKIKTRPGDHLSQTTVDEDIKRLYSTGFFTDVSA